MSKFTISKLNGGNKRDYQKWLKLLKNGDGGTIFHNPDFLSYHQDRFEEHHLGVFKGEELFGVIPLATFQDGDKRGAKSPYGASYGGFIFKNLLNYSSSKEIVKGLKTYLKQNSIGSITITPPLGIYYRSLSETFNFALLEQGFKIVNSDITSVVPLKSEDLEMRVFTSKLRNMVRKAKRSSIEIVYNAPIDDFWYLMEKTFERHGVSPTHTREEMIYLNQKFPHEIYFNVAYIDKKPVAGISPFKINELVNMSFYLCSDSKYKQSQALSYLVAETIKKSQIDGFKYFDFGTSSVNMVGKENIFKFKESFGAVGIFRNRYYLGDI